MRITYRVDGQDFETLDEAVAHVATTKFPPGADLTREKDPGADGWEWLVFDEADESDEPIFVTIFEMEG